MKRVICLALVAILLFAGICILTQRQQASLLNEYLADLDAYHTPTRDFGSPASFIQLDAKQVVGILYPETDYAFLNEAMQKWIKEITKECTQMSESANTAELSVSYESHQITENIVGIQLQGSFFSNTMAHPVDILYTLHADLSQEVLIDVTDLLDDTRKNDFFDLVVANAGIQPDAVDDELLENALLTKDNMHITLERGKYLPMSDGTKELVISYSQIWEYMGEDFLAELALENKNEDPLQNDPANLQADVAKPQIDPNKPMLALTFDDGPSAHTDRLLDIFKQYGGHGTFFVLGELIDNRQSTMVRIVQEGHEVGNHSWNHRQMTNLSDQEIMDQIMSTRAKIYEVTGRDCTIMRPPYGAINDQVKAIGKKGGISFINWSVDTLDWKTKNAEAVYEQIIQNASDGAIILCHDLHATTVDAMETVIPKLLEEGYQLVTISQLMEFSKEPLKPGKLYFKKS